MARRPHQVSSAGTRGPRGVTVSSCGLGIRQVLGVEARFERPRSGTANAQGSRSCGRVFLAPGVMKRGPWPPSPVLTRWRGAPVMPWRGYRKGVTQSTVTPFAAAMHGVAV